MDKTGQFIVQIGRLVFALAVVGGTVALIGRYDQRAAWLTVIIVLLGIFVFQPNSDRALNDFLESLGMPTQSLAKKG